MRTVRREKSYDPETQTKLRHIFNSYAEKAVKDFPHLEGHLAIIHSPSGTVLTGGNIDKTRFESDEHLEYVLYDMKKMGNKMGSFATVDPETGLAVICLNRSMNPTDCDEQNMLFELDHELGHLSVPEAMHSHDKSTNFKECAADVYACLKNKQRFGDDAQLIDRLIELRNEGLIRGDVDHFTSVSLKLLKPLLNEIDFDRITPHQMTTLAWRIAAKAELEGIERRGPALRPILTGRFPLSKEEALEGIPLRPPVDGPVANVVPFQKRRNDNISYKFG